MIFIDNVNFLREKFPTVWNKVRTDNPSLSDRVKVVIAKSGLPTLVFEEQEHAVFLHSKYDPFQEAERFVSQFKEVNEYEHVIFYGVGFGYHIEALMNKYPQQAFTLYEPKQAVFSLFLAHRPLGLLPLKKLKNIYLEESSEDTKLNLNHFLTTITNQKVLLVILPSYERVFKESTSEFTDLFSKMVVEKRTALQVNIAFEKRWIVNSLLNLPKIMRTPNILLDINKDHFRGKPALLIAAGPSLLENIEEVRYIKENGLAYIFSVGSAISVMLENGIYPDAACTYDPTPRNSIVFEKVVERGITSIPLVFGSSVGFETLITYPGPMLHMLTSQDTLAPFLLRGQTEMKLDTVQDAPSIAVVTLQLLNKLGCNPIYLVGQNLAYKDDRLYAQGIDYLDNQAFLTAEEKRQAIVVKDVYGGSVYTNQGFNSMRMQIEYYIQSFVNQEVYNTTKGGAEIVGASFVPLEQVISHKLSKQVVNRDWKVGKSSYDLNHFTQRMEQMEFDYNNLFGLISKTIEVLRELESSSRAKEELKLEALFPKLDKALNRIKNNKFYEIFLLPMNRVYFELLNNQTVTIRFEQNQILKAEKIIKEFGKFIFLCKRDLELITPVWRNIKEEVLD